MPSLFRRVLITLFIALSLYGCSSKEERTPSGQERQAAATYQGYRFGGDAVMDLGSQPITLPEAAVAELLSRDMTLEERLAMAGMELRVHPFFKGKDIAGYLATRQLDGGIFADMPTLTALATGNFVVVAQLKQGFASIISKRPMLVRDLKGRRVATGVGSAAHFALLSALESEGLSERDIELVPMEVSEMAQALDNESIDAFSSWEPTPTITLAQHPEWHLINKGISYGFLCLRREFVAQHPELVRELAASVARACMWMRLPGHLDQVSGWTISTAERFQGGALPLTASQVSGLVRNDLLNIPAAPRILPALLSEEGLLYRKFLFLKQAGKIPQSTPWSRVRDSFDNEMLRKVMADGERFDLQRFHYRSSDPSDGAK
ncbi:MAG: hypothetical protein FPO08_07200 [Geobacter sp.]|nr:MAG: hypothetical protein FPO08_07200 [Geobacter sp.]